jgi:molecular chaperone GrpE
MDKLKKNKPQKTETKNNLNKKININKKESLKINLKSLQNELQKAKEDNLRYLAEIDNLTKRHDKERGDTFKYAVTEFANEIILVVDNFVRVIESISLIKKEDKDKVKPLIEGIDLIYKDFLKTLEKFEIKQIDCLNKKFDPNFHQAVSEEVNNEKESGEIIKVVQTGYLIQERLLRPASVVIAKNEENKKK